MGTRFPNFFMHKAREEILTVNNDTITIESDDLRITDCQSIIIVPEIALTEPGYIRTLTVKADAHAKHEFHAMAQMAYFQYQDDELEITALTSPCRIVWQETTEELTVGMLIYRDFGGEFHVLIHDSLNAKKILEATNRYCTRWVRLDI